MKATSKISSAKITKVINVSLIILGITLASGAAETATFSFTTFGLFFSGLFLAIFGFVSLKLPKTASF